jgi:hypothetical protein
MIKYQSYRRVIDLWTEGEDYDVQAATMGEMMDNILNFIVGGRERLDVTVSGDWRESVEAIAPEISRGSTYRSISARLRSMGMSQKGVLAAAENLRRSGMCYIPSVNSMQVLKFDPTCAAREAARFVLRDARRGGSGAKGEEDDGGQVLRLRIRGGSMHLRGQAREPGDTVRWTR